MKAETQERLAAAARKTYRHRFEADPDSCPCCCGDSVTDDRRFRASDEVLYVVGHGDHNDYPIFRCFCAAEIDEPTPTETQKKDLRKLFAAGRPIILTRSRGSVLVARGWAKTGAPTDAADFACPWFEITAEGRAALGVREEA